MSANPPPPPEPEPEIFEAEISPAAERPGGLRQVVDHRGTILLGLFLVTLFLGLPFLWMSRAFNHREKVVVTILVLIWTVVVFSGFFLVMAWCYQQIQESLQGM